MSRQRFAALSLALLATHAATAQASFFGPSVEKLEPTQRQERIQKQPLAVVAGNGQEGVAVHTKGAAIASLVVGFLAGSAMSSGGAPRPGQSLQANMQQQQQFMQAGMQASQTVTQATNNTMNASAAKQMENHAYPSPAEAMRALLAEQLASQLQSAPISVANAKDNKDVRYVLTIWQGEWMLDFHVMDSLYDLKYNFVTRIYDRQQDTYVLSQNCEGTFPEAYELEAWQADNQTKLFNAMEKVSYQCSNQVLSALSMKPLEMPAATAAPAPQPAAAPQPETPPPSSPAAGTPPPPATPPAGNAAVSPPAEAVSRTAAAPQQQDANRQE